MAAAFWMTSAETSGSSHHAYRSGTHGMDLRITPRYPESILWLSRWPPSRQDGCRRDKMAACPRIMLDFIINVSHFEMCLKLFN